MNRSEYSASQSLQYSARVYGWKAGRNWMQPAPVRPARSWLARVLSVLF